jgi:hypothetical protein
MQVTLKDIIKELMEGLPLTISMGLTGTFWFAPDSQSARRASLTYRVVRKNKVISGDMRSHLINCLLSFVDNSKPNPFLHPIPHPDDNPYSVCLFRGEYDTSVLQRLDIRKPETLDIIRKHFVERAEWAPQKEEK